MNRFGFDVKVILLSSIFIVLYLLAPSSRWVFVVSFFHLASLLFLVKKIDLVFIYLFFPWMVFESGREFETVLVPLQHIQSSVYQSPVVSSFLLSPFLILLCMMCIRFFFVRVAFSYFKRLWPIFLCLVLYFILRMVSVVFTEYSFFFSALYVFRELGIFFWLMFVLSNLDLGAQSNGENNREMNGEGKVLPTIFALFCILFSVELAVSFGQFTLGGYFGLHAEKAHYIAQFGLGADENSALLRVSGFRVHPNRLTETLTESLFAIVLFLTAFSQKIAARKLVFGNFVVAKNTAGALASGTLLFLFLGLISIGAITLSRVVLGVFVFGVLLYAPELKKVSRDLFNFFRGNFALKSELKKVAKRIPKVLYLVGLVAGSVVIFWFSSRISNRVYLSFFSFNENGGITTRMVQFSEAIEVILKRPLFGSGPDMYAAALYQWVPNGEVMYFPEKVHNGFLLIAAESGIFSAGLSFLLLCLVLYCAIKNGYGKIALLLFCYTIITMLLHRVDSHILSVGWLSLLILLFYDQKYAKKNTA